MWLMNGISSTTEFNKSLRPHDQQSPSHISALPFNRAMNIFSSSVSLAALFTICLNFIMLSERWSWKKKTNQNQTSTKKQQTKQNRKAKFSGARIETFSFVQGKIVSLSLLGSNQKENTHTHTPNNLLSERLAFLKSLNSTWITATSNSLQAVFRDLDTVARLLKNAMGFRFWQSTKADSFIWKYNFQRKKKDS